MFKKLKAFWAKINSDINDLWEKDKGFLLLFGVIILVVKFRDILISLIVASSKRLFDKTQQQSDALKTKEDSDNAAADKLVEEANKLTNSNPPPGDDWYKGEK